MHYHGDREIPDGYEVEPPPIYLWTRRLGLAMANRDNNMLRADRRRNRRLPTLLAASGLQPRRQMGHSPDR
jgi:hypothetical protein